MLSPQDITKSSGVGIGGGDNIFESLDSVVL